MTTKIYTVGYSGKKGPKGIEKPSRLLEITMLLNADLVDIRLNARSRVHYWNQSYLKELFEHRYLDLVEFGNTHYQSNEQIALFDFEQGYKRLKQHVQSTGRDVILMCGCEPFFCCHRKTVVDRISNLNTNRFAYHGDIVYWNELRSPKITVALSTSSSFAQATLNICLQCSKNIEADQSDDSAPEIFCSRTCKTAFHRGKSK